MLDMDFVFILVHEKTTLCCHTKICKKKKNTRRRGFPFLMRFFYLVALKASI